MLIKNPRFYLIFLVAFIEMHLVGTAAEGLPYIVNAAIVFAVVLITMLLLNKWFFEKKFKATTNEIGFKTTSIQKIVPGIIISVALLLMFPVLALLLDTKLSLAENWHLNAIGLFLTGGLAEEMVFRGYLFGSLRKQMSFKKATLVSTAIFSLAHLLLFTYFDWPIALMSTILAIGISLPFAFLFERGEDTVWSPALVHTTIRTIGMVVTTGEDKFTILASAWMLASLIIPFVILLFYEDFRALLKRILIR